MPTSHLWAVDSRGKVFTLATNGAHWQELPYSGVDLKRVCALESCVWGIGSDHRVYLYVPSREVQIRVQEVAYENQRWNPKEGYCSRLLPTDRPPWSDVDGPVARPLDAVDLPSSSWQWEGRWYVEDNLDGYPLQREGWTYSVDFPFAYTPEKHWNSMVRRQKWVRHRRYVALDKWTGIPGIHTDPIVEPFVDVAVGGNRVPGGEPGDCAVWAVTVQGRVVFRTGVGRLTPEGRSWVDAQLPEGDEASQVSVGPTGLTWVVAWNGGALVRLGVSRENYRGTSWARVKEPEGDHKLTQVAVGSSTVWAVCRDGTVWFRKGIRGEDLGCEASVTGSGWVKMVGEMAVVSVGPNDQVWGLRKGDRRVCSRMGVTLQEASGREWKEIRVPVGRPLSRTSSGTSLASVGSWPPATPKGCKESADRGGSSDAAFFSASLEGVVCDSPQRKPAGGTGDVDQASEAVSAVRDLPPLHSPSPCRRPTSGGDADYSDLSAADVWSREDGSDVRWHWLSGSACTIDNLVAPPAWFSAGRPHAKVGQESAPWRQKILSRLRSTRCRETKDFPYESAVEKSSWVKSARCLLWRDSHPQQWVHCKLELERQVLQADKVESVVLGLRYTRANREKKMAINVAAVTCVADVSTRDRRVLCVCTEELNRKRTFLSIAFASDEELEDWMATLNIAACDTRDLDVRPGERSIWAVAPTGDVFVQSAPDDDRLPLDDGFWRYLGGGHFRVVESCPWGVAWGIGYDGTPWAYTGGYGGGAYKGVAGHNVDVHPMTDTKCVYVYENQRWNPLTGFAARGLPTDRPMWSDADGLAECTKENARLDSVHWQWLSDWAVDYKTPGGVDADGWQYAMDFPFSYHARKGMTDYVRRRRWFRLCRLHTTGPWLEVEPVPLKDVSLVRDPRGHSVAVWAVAASGEVLYRRGVTPECPQGECWLHVSAEQGFESIGAGGSSSVWAVGKDGSCYVRVGVSADHPTGTTWFHIEPPPGSTPVQISTGRTTVCVVDAAGRLWYREQVMPAFPEGTSWAHVADDVRSVSVSPDDQIWAVVDSVRHGKTVRRNVLARRKEVSAYFPQGTEWEVAFGPGWSRVSVGGYARTEEDDF